MKLPKVIIIAQNQPLDNDAHLRRKLADAEERAERQSARFPDLDLLNSFGRIGPHRCVIMHVSPPKSIKWVPVWYAQ